MQLCLWYQFRSDLHAANTPGLHCAGWAQHAGEAGVLGPETSPRCRHSGRVDPPSLQWGVLPVPFLFGEQGGEVTRQD